MSDNKPPDEMSNKPPDETSNKTSNKLLNRLSDRISNRSVAKLLESLIPGYPLISKIFDLLGLDLTNYSPYVVLSAGFCTGLYFCCKYTSELVQRYHSYSVHFESHDPLFRTLLSYLVRGGYLDRARSWIAETPVGGLGTTVKEYCVNPVTGYVNFASQQYLDRLRLEPDEGSVWFRWRRQWFRLERKRYFHLSEQMTQRLELRVFRRSRETVRELIAEAQKQESLELERETVIMRPRGKEALEKQYFPWREVVRRPIRHIDTVILEKSAKEELLNDMNLFWKRAEMDRYAARGIPYRRGYMFHGPPGTGKSSLAYAVAGIFGVDIFCLALTDPAMNDGHLLTLLSNLPQHCIVLMEDIDSGNFRSRDAVHNESGGRYDGNEKSVTLHGLLNAIDGVGAAEGRILIITTNFPERLDAALLRPGRIDFKVQFKQMSKAEAEQLFLRLYDDGTDEANRGDLSSLARTFSDAIPDRTISPAELQGFILTHRNPADAVNKVAGWRDELLKEKEAN